MLNLLFPSRPISDWPFVNMYPLCWANSNYNSGLIQQLKYIYRRQRFNTARCVRKLWSKYCINVNESSLQIYGHLLWRVNTEREIVNWSWCWAGFVWRWPPATSSRHNVGPQGQADPAEDGVRAQSEEEDESGEISTVHGYSRNSHTFIYSYNTGLYRAYIPIYRAYISLNIGPIYPL